MSEQRWVGRRVVRVDGPEKVTGATKYMTDLSFPDALVGRVLRSPHPHALIRSIDTSKARALEGVVCVLTAADVPGLNAFGVIIQDQPVLAAGKVRMTGDAVALVAAEDEEIAEQALALIDVDYEPLPVVTDPEEAMKPDAPRVHADGNLVQHVELKRGDFASALAADDDLLVVEGSFVTPRQMHAPVETEGGWAQVDANGNLTVWCPAQNAYRDRMQLARILGWNPNRIRIISNPLGGAFGVKDELTVQHYLALLALHTGGRPVKIHYKREESVIATVKRHPFRIRARLAVRRNGTFAGYQARIVADKGAYASLGLAVLNMAIEHAAGPYKLDHLDVDGYNVYTNNGTNGAFRGFGVPQCCFALESLIDEAADQLGIDRLAIRKQNVVRQGDIDAAGHEVEGSAHMVECLETIERSDLWQRREEWIAAAPFGKRRGVGVAAAVHGVGMGKGVPDYCGATIEMDGAGRFRVFISPQDIGQGNSTTYLLLAAEELKCDLADMQIVQGDTAQVPDGGSATASRSTYAGGGAVVDAARNMGNRLKQGAGVLLGAPPDEVVLEHGRAHAGGRSVSYGEIAQRLAPSGGVLKADGFFVVPEARHALEGVVGAPHYACGYVAQAALVEVDAFTGESHVEKVISVIDCGQVINPLGLEGQSEGGVVMGMGFALTEDTIIENGIHKTRNITNYILPTTVEAPQIETVAVESHEETGPRGAKGIGELVMVPIVGAIANAVSQAAGARLYHLPATPERVWRAMRDQARQEGIRR